MRPIDPASRRRALLPRVTAWLLLVGLLAFVGACQVFLPTGETCNEFCASYAKRCAKTLFLDQNSCNLVCTSVGADAFSSDCQACTYPALFADEGCATTGDLCDGIEKACGAGDCDPAPGAILCRVVTLINVPYSKCAEKACAQARSANCDDQKVAKCQ